MSNYYEYREIGARIAEILMNKPGWKVYGYHEDESDLMTDYWSPAYWSGVAEKNGYVLCVNVYGAEQAKEIKKYNTEGRVLDAKSRERIEKLRRMTQERGASPNEEATAKKAIAKLEASVSKEKYIITGLQPAHMAHPPRCNWHVEKDGKYILKGNGLLKFSSIAGCFRYPKEKEELFDFKRDPETWEKDRKESYSRGTEEQRIQWAKSLRKEMEKKLSLYNNFNEWINKIDTACGSTLGDGEYYEYETITETKYKTEMKPVLTKEGSIKEGQCFILAAYFTHGANKGDVYRIHVDNRTYAYRLNGKYTKECKGMARGNHWSTFGEKFSKWIAEGAISWCEIKEVKTPYEVEKIVKHKKSSDQK